MDFTVQTVIFSAVCYADNYNYDFFSISATIRTRPEIQCLLYAGSSLNVTSLMDSVVKAVFMLKPPEVALGSWMTQQTTENRRTTLLID